MVAADATLITTVAVPMALAVQSEEDGMAAGAGHHFLPEAYPHTKAMQLVELPLIAIQHRYTLHLSSPPSALPDNVSLDPLDSPEPQRKFKTINPRTPIP